MKWPMVKLEEVAEIQMGQAPAGETYNTRGEGLPLIAGAGDFGDEFPDSGKFTTIPTKIAEENDIILSIRATIGTKVISNNRYCLGRGVAGIRAKNGLAGRYLWHWLSQSAAILASKGRGATFPQVSRADVASLWIPLPPFDEQKRIAAILDKADALRRKRRQALALLDGLTQSIFLKMFGDCASFPKLSFGELVENSQIGLVRSAAEIGDEHATPYVRMDAITNDGRMSLDGVRKTTVSPAEAKRYSLSDGDFLFNTRNSRELVGKSAIYDGPAGFTYNNNILRVRFATSINSRYVAAYFQSTEGRKAIEARKSGTTSVFAVYQKALDAIEIPIPPSERQQEFAEKALGVSKMRERILASISTVDALFASLQHRAFNGEL